MNLWKLQGGKESCFIHLFGRRKQRQRKSAFGWVRKRFAGISHSKEKKAMKNKSAFKFELYATEGNSGFRLILFAENLGAALAKARETVDAQYFRIQSVEEIQTEGE